MESPVNPENIQNTVNAAVDQAVTKPVQQVEKKLPRFFKRKPFLISAILLIILIVVLAVVTMNFGKKEPNAIAQDTLLVTVADRKIYKSTVTKEAHKHYAEGTLSSEILKNYLDVLIEQTILDSEVLRAGIKVEATESAERAKTYVGGDETKLSKNLFVKAKYDLLKEEIMNQFLSSRTIYQVGFWTPDSTYPEEYIPKTVKDELPQRRSEGKLALAEINFLVKRGTDILDATKEVMKKPQYSTIKKIIAVNGYILATTTNEDLMRISKVITSKDRDSIDTTLYNAIFSMKEGEVKLVLAPENASGYVVKIIKASDGQYKTYQEWLDAKKKDLVVYNNSL